MRRTQTPAVSSQMYRTFATVTVVLTVAVAFFANGDNEQASAAPAATSSVPVNKAPAVPAKPTFRDATGDGGGWGFDGDSDDSSAFAAPSSDSGALPPPFAGISDPSPSAGDGNQAKGASQAANSPMPTAEEIAAAQAASRLRSGSAGSG
jgi:hypothetical protein